jgi:hypothetical protein
MTAVQQHIGSLSAEIKNEISEQIEQIVAFLKTKGSLLSERHALSWI